MVKVGQAEYDRSMELVGLRIKRLDALHVACAEAARCDVLLTTDDPLLRIAARHARQLRVDVRNPLDWLLEQNL